MNVNVIMNDGTVLNGDVSGMDEVAMLVEDAGLSVDDVVEFVLA